MTIGLTKRAKETAERERDAIRDAARQIKASPESARAFLIKGGFVKPNGELHENYR